MNWFDPSISMASYVLGLSTCAASYTIVDSWRNSRGESLGFRFVYATVAALFGFVAMGLLLVGVVAVAHWLGW